jgi:hypothetical protein
VSLGEVREALLCLAQRGEIRAYVFDQAAQRFVEVNGTGLESHSDLWFLAR